MAAKTRAPHTAARGLAVCGGLALGLTGTAFALGIGTPEASSYLTEPLLLRVPIDADRTDLRTAAVQARILPASAYALFGLSPPGQPLPEFKISIQGDREQGYWLKVTSEKAIREPILSLLIEIRDRHGSLIRHVDLLLDPPAQSGAIQTAEAKPAPSPEAVPAASRQSATTTSASQTAEATDAPSAAVIIRQSETGTVPAQTTHAAAPSSPKLAPPDPRNFTPGAPAILTGTAGEYGPIRRGEVLSRISQLVRPDPNISIHKMSAALYQLNPQAFDGSPHSLRAGAYLRVPGSQELDLFNGHLAWYRADGHLEQNAPRSAPKTRPSVVAAAQIPAAPQPNPRYRLQLAYSLTKAQSMSGTSLSGLAAPGVPLQMQTDWRPDEAAAPAPSNATSPQLLESVAAPLALSTIETASAEAAGNNGAIASKRMDVSIPWWQSALLLISALAAFFVGLFYRRRRDDEEAAMAIPQASVEPQPAKPSLTAEFAPRAAPRPAPEIPQQIEPEAAPAAASVAQDTQAEEEMVAATTRDEASSLSIDFELSEQINDDDLLIDTGNAVHLPTDEAADDRPDAELLLLEELNQRIEHLLSRQDNDRVTEHQCEAARKFIASGNYDDAEWMIRQLEEALPKVTEFSPGHEPEAPSIEEEMPHPKVVNLGSRQN